MNHAPIPWLLLVVAACSASAPQPSAAPAPVASAPASSASEEQAGVVDTASAAEPPPPTASAAAEPAPAGAGLPPVDEAAAKTCREAHGAALEPKSPEYGPARLAEAAACFERAGALGVAIKIRGTLIRDFGDAPEALDALRAMGAGYERAGRLYDAARRYEEYAQRFPKQDDARGLLEHATCIQAGLGADAAAGDDLKMLMRLWGRKHYPAPPTVETLCAQKPSGSP